LLPAARNRPGGQIDLGREIFMTRVRVLNRVSAGQAGEDRAATLRLSLSKDGRNRQEVWKADKVQAAWEIPVNEFRAGVRVPGRKARYLQLDLYPARPEYFRLRQVEAWGRD
jgi:hypothetical protein